MSVDGTPPIYLDHNATAPLAPEARAAMEAAFDVCGNPSSVHGFGRAARRLVEDARERVAALVGARPAQVIFTGGGTEANNLAIKGISGGRVMVSAIEHDSVLRAAPDGDLLPVGGDGVVDLEALAAALAAASGPGRGSVPGLVSLMLANNETGIVQPVAEAAVIAHAAGARLHCDAVQAAGKMPVDFPSLGVDFMTLSAHKLGGPTGVGALILREDATLDPLIAGGGQERRRRAGTENVSGIAGFGAAAEAAQEGLATYAGLAVLRDDLEARALVAVPGARVIGAGTHRLVNTSCLALPGVVAGTQVMALDLAGVAVSAGSACSSGKVEPSHVLQAMGVDSETVSTAIRVSLGRDSAPADVDRFLDAWVGLSRRRSSGVGPAA